MATETKLEDGIWSARYMEDTTVVFIQGNRWGSYRERPRVHPLDGSTPLHPLRRIADLDGKPVVDEGVIEALLDAIRAKEQEAMGDCIVKDYLRPILLEHLCPSKPEAGGEGEAEQQRDCVKERLADIAEYAMLKGDELHWWNDKPHQVVRHLVKERDRLQARVAELDSLRNFFKQRGKEPKHVVGHAIRMLEAAEQAQRDKVVNEASGQVVKSWTYRQLEPSRYIVTDNDKLVFGCPTAEEAAHLANYLNRMVAELEARPTTNRYRETATGDDEANEECDGAGSKPPSLAIFVKLADWAQKAAGEDGMATLLTNGSEAWEMEDAIYWAAKIAVEHCSEATPIPAADAPIVPFEGAFVCWDGNGAIHTAWPLPDANSYEFAVTRHSDKHTDLHMSEDFDDTFTRQPPPTLTPEQEALVGPLADLAKRTPEETRQFLATCKKET